MAIVAATPTFSDRNGGANGNAQARVGRRAIRLGTPADSRPTRMMSPSRKAKSQRLVSPFVVRSASRRPGRGAPHLEPGPRIVAGDRQGVEIVHSGAPEAAVAETKAGRLDDRRVDAETGAGAHHRPGVLGDVRLDRGRAEAGRRAGSSPATLTPPARGKWAQAVASHYTAERDERSNAATLFGPMDIENDRCEKPPRTRMALSAPVDGQRCARRVHWQANHA